MTFCRIIILLVVTLLAGCAIDPPTTDNSSATVLDNQTGRWIPSQDLPKKLADADYIIIGEMHDSLTMRDQLINTLETLRHDNQLGALVMDVLKSRLLSSSKTYLEQLDSFPPALADRYRPIVIWAEQSEVALVGAAITREKKSVLKNPKGQEWLDQQTQGVLSDKQKTQLKQFLGDYHPESKEDSNANYLLGVQQLKDYFMARTLISTGVQSVLLTRPFHARKDLGVNPYLRKLKPGSKVLTVLMLGNQIESNLSQDALDLIKQEYDFIWLQKPENHLLLAPSESIETTGNNPGKDQ